MDVQTMRNYLAGCSVHFKMKNPRYKEVMGGAWYTANHGVAQFSEGGGCHGMVQGDSLTIAKLSWAVLSAVSLFCFLEKFFLFFLNWSSSCLNWSRWYLATHVSLQLLGKPHIQAKDFQRCVLFMFGHSQKSGSIFVTNLINISHVAVMKAPDSVVRVVSVAQAAHAVSFFTSPFLSDCPIKVEILYSISEYNCLF